MKNDISIYENIKRNEECPCGSGKIFKKCCMSEYREAKKSYKTQESYFSDLKSAKVNQIVTIAYTEAVALEIKGVS